jgi:undecaprenyl-diphosphatase
VFVSVVAIAQVASEVTKRLIGRPRPSLVPHLDLALSSSFPSGHALMSPVVYLTLAMTLTGKPGSGPDRALILAGAVMLCAAIGISRVFLGVHWPSDVLGGWSLGAAIALAAGAVIRVADEKSAQGNP